jgi:hypothetical protein
VHRAQIPALAIKDDQAMIVGLSQAPVDPAHQRTVRRLAMIPTRERRHDLNAWHRGNGI